MAFPGQREQMKMTARASSLGVSPHVPRCASSLSLMPTTSEEIWQRIRSISVYNDAFWTVVTMLVLSVVSGLVALGSNLVFTLGLFVSGKSPAYQTYTQFLAATLINSSICLGLPMLLGFTVPLTKYRWIHRPDAPLPFFGWAARLFMASSGHYGIELLCIIAIANVSESLGPKWHEYNLPFFVTGLVVNYFSSAVDVTSRRLFQTETVQGVALRHVNNSPLVKRLAVAYVKNFGFVIGVALGAVYIQAASRIQITTQWSLLAFGLGSMAVRALLMKITRHFVLKRKKLHVRFVYAIVALPTVMINTQVRVALLRVQASLSLTGVLVLALIEPLMRVLKVWTVRRDAGATRARGAWPRAAATMYPQRAVLPCGDQGRGIPDRTGVTHSHTKRRSLTAMLSMRLQRTQRLLEFTAAEIHADMCSEFIAIACSMSIYYCLDGHPKFAWNKLQQNDRDDQHDSTETAAGAGTASLHRVTLVVVQVVVEIVIDWICCWWECVNGIPLRTTTEINRFLVVLLTGLAMGNIAVCCSFYLLPP